MNTGILDVVDAHRDELHLLCRRYGVASLDLFGSGARDDWEASRSDLDFLVTFRHDSSRSLADRFLGLAQDLEALFGVPVELLTRDSIRNPYLRAAIQSARVPLYAE